MGFFQAVHERARPARNSRFELDVAGDVIISRGFVDGAGRLRDKRPAWHHIHDHLLNEWSKNFASEGQYAGHGWDDLADPTVKQRERLGIGGNHPILDRSGASYDGHQGGQLKRAMTEKGAAKVRITRSMFEFSPNVDYAQLVQQGTSRMPARPFADLTEGGKRGITGILHRHVMGTL